MEKVLVEMMKKAKTAFEEGIKYAENNNLTNTQVFLNYMDEINKLSVKY